MIMDYRFEQFKADDNSLRELIGLFELSYAGKSDKLSLSFLQWQYLDNPAGEVVGFNAYAGEKLVAHYVAIPYYMDINGKPTLGLLSLNTATHPEHQGKRLFTRLAEMTYSFASENGYKFVIGVANQNSTHGFLKHLKFSLISPLIFKVGIGKVKYPVSSDFVFCGTWDTAFLEWRLKNPSFSYYKNGENVVSPISVGFKKIIFNDCKGVAPDGMPRLRLRPFTMYIGIGGKPSGIFINMPKFIPHSPFNLIFRDLTNGDLPQMDKDNVLFQLIDFDVA